MKLLSLDSWKGYDEALEETKKALLEEELIIYPTDTLYGLGANALSEKAVEKVVAAKRREKKPISIIVSDVAMMGEYCKISSQTSAVLQEFFPGPVTAIFFKKYEFPKNITETDKIAVRIPHHYFILTIVKSLKFPITATSANFSGEKPPKKVEEIPNELKEMVKVVVDGGRCKYGVGSTVIDFTMETPKIVREGADFERISKTLETFSKR
jgi:L-threonylcarbamoyladenylate synthase